MEQQAEVEPLADTDVQPGYLVLDIIWLTDVHTFQEGDLVPVVLLVMDDQYVNALDPESVTFTYTPGTQPQDQLIWDYASWDGVTIESPSVGTIARTNQGVFEAWLDSSGKPGNWEVQGSTTGAGQGTSPIANFVVAPQT